MARHSHQGKWPGSWRVVCDICGLQFPSTSMQTRWDGLIVDRRCFEYRHPQDFVRGVPDMMAAPFVRRDNDPVFSPYCTVGGQSGYAGFAVAGCMIAGNNTVSPEIIESIYAEATN